MLAMKNSFSIEKINSRKLVQSILFEIDVNENSKVKMEWNKVKNGLVERYIFHA